MKKPLIIFGAGGLGREIKTLVDALPEWQLMGFCDDGVSAGEEVMEVPILGDMHYLLNQRDDMHVLVAIGNPTLKVGVVERLASSAFLRFPSMVHPRAILGDPKTIHLGPGTIIAAGCILTTSVNLGKHVLLNLNCTVGHDTVIDDYTSIMPGVNLAGHVSIGKRSLLGSGVNVLNKIQIGDDAIVGSGAVVIRNISTRTTAVGVPAKAIKSHGK